MKEALTSAGLTLHNRRGITIGLHPLGATWTSCRLPLPDQVREVLLGSRDVVAMLLEGGSYLGASVGRYAGRIAQARFGDHVLDASQPTSCMGAGRDWPASCGRWIRPMSTRPRSGSSARPATRVFRAI